MDLEIKSLLDAQGQALDQAMEKFEGQLAESGKVSIEAKAEVKALAEKFDASITELAQKMDSAKQESTILLSAGAEFVKSEQFKQLVAGNVEKVRLDVKNTVLGNGNTVLPAQNSGVIAGNYLPLTIRQLFSTIPVSSNAIDSLREASWTNDAAEVSEGAAKPESDITFEPYTVNVKTVAHWIKVSNQLLADAPAITAYIDTRLRDGLAQRIDAQLLNGNGTSPNLSGLTDSGNFTAYTATSGDNLVDAINRAKWALWATGNTPDTVIVNPADWGAMEIARESGTSGMYLMGVAGQPVQPNLFGLRVVPSNHMAVGKFLVGSINTSTALYTRSGAVVEMGYVNADFTNNLVTIRAEERLGLGVERPSGILYGNFTA